MGRQTAVVLASGFAALDAELPGGGWPLGVLTELLLPHAGVGELRLLAPALRALGGSGGASGSGGGGSRGGAGTMLFDPPADLCGWALGALGLDTRQLVVVQGRAGSGSRGGLGGLGGRTRAPLSAADMLWALEQALKSGHVGAVLAWLPARLRADALRRLQLAAQSHPGPVFLFREAEARARPSAAPLRLLLAPAGLDELSLHLFKRRGPPLAQPLRLALAPVLPAAVRARALVARSLPGAAPRAVGAATAQGRADASAVSAPGLAI